MDKQTEVLDEVEAVEMDLVELAPAALREVAGGQNGTAHGDPR
jgi:hypothetical protein